MKEATGEFSMTVVTILAILVIAGLVGFLGPKIKKYVEGSWKTVAENCPKGYKYDNSLGYCVKK